jgi:CHAD domain-containing protein
VAKAREIPGFSEAESFREAAALAVETRTDELFGFREGVLDTSDIERVHDMRVASRRLRAVMEIFAPCFPKAEFRRTLRDVKDIADALGERRDPDVQIHAIERVGAKLTEDDRVGLGSLVDELHRRQEAGNEHLAGELERIEREGLRERLLALATAARTA